MITGALVVIASEAYRHNSADVEIAVQPNGDLHLVDHGLRKATKNDHSGVVLVAKGGYWSMACILTDDINAPQT